MLCGKGGCGKTTMTRLLNGMTPDFYDGTLDEPSSHILSLRNPDVYIFVITYDYEFIVSACDDVIESENSKWKILKTHLRFFEVLSS